VLLKRGAAIALMFVARAAFATPTSSECVDADTAGQVHRRQGRLLAARADLSTCADAACPDMIRADCRGRLAELTRAVPSISAVANVTGSGFLTLDGASIPLDGAPVDTDPGPHELTLTVAGHEPVTQRFDLKEADKGHRIVFPAMVAIVRARMEPRTTSSGIGALRIAGLATGAAGLVALGFGVGFGVASFGAWSTAKSECADATTCDLVRATSDRSRAYDFATGSDIAFVAAGVLAAAGVTMFLLGGHATVTASSDRVAFFIGGSF
jgi:hypothetical protein